MREGFKHQLETAIRAAGDTAKVDEVTAVATEKMTRIAGSETWQDIESIQEEKRALMNEYREWRKKFWRADGPNGEERAEALARIGRFENGESGKTLRVRPDGGYEAVLKGGEIVALTKGETFAASEWGTWWKFDPSVPNDTQLALMSSQVRARLAERYDDQLIAFGSHDRLADDRKREAYVRMGDSQQSLDTMPDGILAEKMLVSFLTKMMHDSEYEFTVTRADAYDDIEHKIDFVITVADRRRGVRVGEPEHRVGIQFTLDENKVKDKERQLARAGARLGETDVDELVLVAMPIDDIGKNYQLWRLDERGERRNEKRLDPRGPDRFWSEETKRAVMDALIRAPLR